MRLYYPFEITVIRGGMDETYMNITPACMDVIQYSRSRIDHASSLSRQTTRVSDENVKILMRECEISRQDAEDALMRTDDDLYLAAVDAVCT